jgi:hypothetical protein
MHVVPAAVAKTAQEQLYPPQFIFFCIICRASPYL